MAAAPRQAGSRRRPWADPEKQPRVLAWAKRRLRRDVHERGQGVGQRLAAARLGDADHVAAGEGGGPPNGLDRRRLVEARGEDNLRAPKTRRPLSWALARGRAALVIAGSGALALN